MSRKTYWINTVFFIVAAGFNGWYLGYDVAARDAGWAVFHALCGIACIWGASVVAVRYLRRG